MIKIDEEVLRQMLISAWFAGFGESKYSPNPSGTAKISATHLIDGFKQDRRDESAEQAKIREQQRRAEETPEQAEERRRKNRERMRAKRAGNHS